jgi:hypothetical protein
MRLTTYVQWLASLLTLKRRCVGANGELVHAIGARSMLVGWEEIHYTIPSTSDPCSICVPNHECADHLQPCILLGHAPTSRSTHVGCQLSIAGELLPNRWEWCVGDVISWRCSFYFAVASSLPTDAIRSRNLTFKTTERLERPFASKALDKRT